MEIEKAEKLFKQINEISRQETKRSSKTYDVYLKASDSVGYPIFFSMTVFFLLGFLFSIELSGLNLTVMSNIFFSFIISLTMTYIIFWKTSIKNLKRKKRWNRKLKKLSEKKQKITEDFNLLMIEKIDDYFNEIEELEKEDKLDILSGNFVDEVIEAKREKILASTGRSNAIREVSILEKEVNEMTNNSFITNN